MDHPRAGEPLLELRHDVELRVAPGLEPGAVGLDAPAEPVTRDGEQRRPHQRTHARRPRGGWPEAAHP
jgi:hypothetical protein